jgi:hypothetical protein
MSVGGVEELTGYGWAVLDGLAERAADACAASTARWVYAPWGAGWEQVRPYWHERFGDKPVTRAHKSPPTELRDVDVYAYDDSGSLVLARRFGPRPSRLESEHVWAAAEDGAPIQLRRTPRPEGLRVVSALRPRHEAGRLVAVDERFRDPGGGASERYAYEGDRIAHVAYEQDAGRSFRGGFTVDYDSGGALLMLVGDSGRVLYRRSTSAGVRNARSLAEERLPRRIAEWAVRVGADSPIYALGIVYSADNPYSAVPYLGIGTEGERARRTSELAGDDLRNALWNPAEWDRLDADPREVCEDDELVAACQVLEQEWRSLRQDNAAPRLFARCAAEIAKMSPVRALFARDEIVVYAVDSELTNLETGLKKAAPAALRRRLESTDRTP